MKRIGAVLVSGIVVFLIFGNSTSALYSSGLASASCAGTIVLLACVTLGVLSKVAGQQYEAVQRRKAKPLDESAAPVQICQRCGSMSVVAGMCTVCDVEVGIL